MLEVAVGSNEVAEGGYKVTEVYTRRMKYILDESEVPEVCLRCPRLLEFTSGG
jgi:hypothetical protein